MTPSQPQNKLTELAVLAIAALLIVCGAFLLYAGKIDFTGMLTLLGFAGGALGINGAFKAPSPAQQATMQGLFTQLMDVLPRLFTQSQQPITIHNNLPAPVAPVAPLQGVQPAPVPARPQQFSVPPFTAPQASVGAVQGQRTIGQ